MAEIPDVDVRVTATISSPSADLLVLVAKLVRRASHQLSQISPAESRELDRLILDVEASAVPIPVELGKYFRPSGTGTATGLEHV